MKNVFATFVALSVIGLGLGTAQATDSKKETAPAKTDAKAAPKKEAPKAKKEVTPKHINNGVTKKGKKEMACGGVIEASKDCDGNRRSWHVSCCPDDYRVQGVAYNEFTDAADAVSSVCRSIKKGNIVIPQDFSTVSKPKNFTCEKQEVFAGIDSKDVYKTSDRLDGVTAFCQTPGSTKLRRIANKDIDANSRSGRAQTVLLGNRVVGIAYKDMDDSDKSGPGTSDRSDCATIIVKHENQ